MSPDRLDRELVEPFASLVSLGRAPLGCASAKDATMSAKDATMSAKDETRSAKDATRSAIDATRSSKVRNHERQGAEGCDHERQRTRP